MQAFSSFVQFCYFDDEINIRTILQAFSSFIICCYFDVEIIIIRNSLQLSASPAATPAAARCLSRGYYHNDYYDYYDYYYYSHYYVYYHYV